METSWRCEYAMSRANRRIDALETEPVININIGTGTCREKCCVACPPCTHSLAYLVTSSRTAVLLNWEPQSMACKDCCKSVFFVAVQ